MKLHRGLAGAVLLICAAGTWAQTYPAKPIRFIVPWPAGGGADVLSRMLVPRLSEALGQQLIIDNRGGAAGNIGAELAAKSAPDGYTMVFAYSGTHSINPSIYSKMPFKESDFAPIVWLASVPQLMVVHPSIPVKTIKQLIALAKTKAGELAYGSSGSGAVNHLAGELFTTKTGAKLIHVPYRGGGPANIALLGGEIAILLGDPAPMIPHVSAGRVRPIAVTSGRRALAFPELPTVAESGVPGYEVTSWGGILVPAGVPANVTNRLNAEFNTVIVLPEMKQRMIEHGYEPEGGAPERFSQHIHAEISKWAPVVKAAGLKVD